jgi:L-2-hydroxyglutarate oxidase LhgO
VSGERVDVVVAGGGLVGVAVARELARSGREVLLLEAERTLGVHTSSRNSEVIHAGIYHAPDTLKAQLCVRGRSLLYRFCEERSVPHRRVGKLLVAVDDTERPGLAVLAAHGARCGVDDLRALSAADVRALLPGWWRRRR